MSKRKPLAEFKAWAVVRKDDCVLQYDTWPGTPNLYSTRKIARSVYEPGVEQIRRVTVTVREVE